MYDTIRCGLFASSVTLFASVPEMFEFPLEKIGFGALLFFIIWTYMKQILPKTQEEMQKLRAELTGELPSVEVPLIGRAYAAGFFAQMQNAFASPYAPAGFWDLFSKTAAGIWDGGSAQTELGALVEELKPPEDEPGIV